MGSTKDPYFIQIYAFASENSFPYSFASCQSKHDLVSIYSNKFEFYTKDAIVSASEHMHKV